MAKRKKTTRGGSFRGKFKTGKTKRSLKTHSQKRYSLKAAKNP